MLAGVVNALAPEQVMPIRELAGRPLQVNVPALFRIMVEDETHTPALENFVPSEPSTNCPVIFAPDDTNIEKSETAVKEDNPIVAEDTLIQVPVLISFPVTFVWQNDREGRERRRKINIFILLRAERYPFIRTTSNAHIGPHYNISAVCVYRGAGSGVGGVIAL